MTTIVGTAYECSGASFDTLFTATETGHNPASTCGYKYNGADLTTLYGPWELGDYAQTTGFIGSNKLDLNTYFQNKSVPYVVPRVYFAQEGTINMSSKNIGDLVNAYFTDTANINKGKPKSVNIMCVVFGGGGGQGGGNNQRDGGGGGAGACLVIQRTNISLTNNNGTLSATDTIAITLGGGGGGADGYLGAASDGKPGGSGVGFTGGISTVIVNTNFTYTATGGHGGYGATFGNGGGGNGGTIIDPATLAPNTITYTYSISGSGSGGQNAGTNKNVVLDYSTSFDNPHTITFDSDNKKGSGAWSSNHGTDKSTVQGSAGKGGSYGIVIFSGEYQFLRAG